MRMHVNIKSLNLKKLILILIPILLGLGILFYALRPTEGIYEFDYNRDAQEIHQLFDRDWYWLVAASRDEYDVDFVLRYRARKYDVESFGSLQVKVLRDNNEFKGFVIYYKKSPELGKMLFLSVKEDSRKKGYGTKLAKYAINDLFAQGVKKVEIVTRPSNERGLKLYDKLGFKETGRDDIFVYLEKQR